MLSAAPAFGTIYEVRPEADFWTGYVLPQGDASAASLCSKFPSLGNRCSVGGFAWGGGFYLAQIFGIISGVGIAYLPVADGTLKITDTQLLNIGSAYMPMLAQWRFDFSIFHVQAGAGYSIAVETPRAYPQIGASAAPGGAYTLMIEPGIRLKASEQITFYASAKLFTLLPSQGGDPLLYLVPTIGMQANLSEP